MKIKVVSDLHLEFLETDFFLPNNGADVLVLSGDICVANHLYRNPIDTSGLTQKDWNARDAARYRKFFDQVSADYEHVLCVMGNHEHYDGLWERTETILRDEFSRYGNIHLLERDTFDLDGIRFLGATFWTSMDRRNDLTMLDCTRFMTDYKVILSRYSGGVRPLMAVTTVEDHEHSVKWLEQKLRSHSGPTVVIGHHAPSRQSIHPKYAGHPANAAFCDSLEHIMIDNPQIMLWTHGHVHDCFDYKIANTRVFCNPMAYPNETSYWDPSVIIEL
jgi:Icc-related predicted phosphoesterase